MLRNVRVLTYQATATESTHIARWILDAIEADWTGYREEHFKCATSGYEHKRATLPLPSACGDFGPAVVRSRRVLKKS